MHENPLLSVSQFVNHKALPTALKSKNTGVANFFYPLRGVQRKNLPMAEDKLLRAISVVYSKVL
jgi:hypothetical protein